MAGAACGQCNSGPTPEQARRELKRRASDASTRIAGRAQARDDGTLRLTTDELRAIAEGDEILVYDVSDHLLRRA